MVPQETWSQGSRLSETLLRVGKLAVWQVDLPFQPAGFFEPTPEPEPVQEPKLCSYSLLFLRDVLSDREFLVNSGASVSVFLGPTSDSTNGVCLLTADGSRWFAAAPRLFLYDFPVVLVLRFIPGHFNSLLYQFLSLELISWSILTSLSTSKDVRGTCTVPRVCRSLHLPYSSACFLPCFPSLPSASDPKTSLRVPGRAQ